MISSEHPNMGIDLPNAFERRERRFEREPPSAQANRAFGAVMARSVQ